MAAKGRVVRAGSETPSPGTLAAGLVAGWIDDLVERHLRRWDLREARRALEALSATYVHRRERLARGPVLDTEAKRAVYAAFYGPLHFLAVAGIVEALGLGTTLGRGRLVDLGCGTGAAGAAWALAAGGASVLGLDRSGWALAEARWTYRRLRLRGTARRAELGRLGPLGRAAGVLAAYAVNELADEDRERLWRWLAAARRCGAGVLLVEPIAKRPVPWWDEWAARAVALGGRADVWRFAAALPEPLRRLDRAAGLDHRTIAARSLWLAPGAP